MCSAASARSLKTRFCFPLPQLLFILISSQYSSLLDHPLISFSSFGPLVGILQYWANQSCKLYTLIFCPPFLFLLRSMGSSTRTFLPIVVMSQFLEQITGNVSWHLTKPVNCVILSPMLLGAVVQNSLWNPSASLRSLRAALFSHEWMNECLVLQQSRCRIGFLKWCITLVYLYQNRVHLCVCVCTCVLFL